MNFKDTDTLESIGKCIRSGNNILIVTHIRPDGDAIGSLLGLGIGLKNIGKQVQLVISDPVPTSFHHLEGHTSIKRQVSGPFDVSVIIDCSDRTRTGKVFGNEQSIDINIDHHVTNDGYARLNYIDPSAVATSELLVECFDAWKIPINKSVAEALLTGIITDTIGFRTSNMSSKVLRVASRLMDAGASLPELYSKSITEKSFEALRFWGAGLSKIERKGEIIWTVLTVEDRVSAGYSGRDDADLINLLSTVRDAKIIMIFVEQPKGFVKVSWRSLPGVDVSMIASQFGGGGHPAASGAEIKGEISEVTECVLKTTYNQLVNFEQKAVQ